MSVPRADVDEADLLARVKLSLTIEPGDLRVTRLVSELGAGKVLGYLEAAAEATPTVPHRPATRPRLSAGSRSTPTPTLAWRPDRQERFGQR